MKTMLRSSSPSSALLVALLLLLLGIVCGATALYSGQRVLRFDLTQEGRFVLPTGGKSDGHATQMRRMTRLLGLELVEAWAEGRRLDVWAHNLEQGWVDVRVPRIEELNGELERLALPYNVLISDVGAEIAREQKQAKFDLIDELALSLDTPLDFNSYSLIRRRG